MSTERAVVVLYEVEPALLARNEAWILQSSCAIACKISPQAASAWKNWGAQTVQNPELDATLRPRLEALLRADGGKRE